MICPRCDSKVKNNSRFCPKCGIAFDHVIPVQTVSLAERFENAMEWIMTNWFVVWIGVIFAIVVVGAILSTCKDVIRDVLFK